METIETTRLLVPEISCAHCERSIVDALTPIKGVEAVVVDIPLKRVTVDFNPGEVSVERLSAVLAEEDYPVTGVEAVTSPAGRILPVVAAGGCSCCAPPS